MSARIEFNQRRVVTELSRMLSPETLKARVAALARAEFAEADAKNTAALGRKVPHTVAVDGRLGASEDTVKVQGRIVYEWAVLAPVLAWIGDRLVATSPVLSGTYARSFAIYVDDVPYTPGDVLPADFSEVAFVNTTPYARKIEGNRGRSLSGQTSQSRSPQSSQAPDGVFHAVAKMAATKFKEAFVIKFSYRAVVEGGIMAYQTSKRAPQARGERGRFKAGGQGRSNSSVVEREARSPAIIVRAKG